MHTFFHISLILLLSCAIHPSTSTTTTTIATHTRRNLHQPLFPQASIPPTQPPSPQTPLSTSTPTQQPFFPTLPSPPPTPSPPPPPSPSTFATFPANVSSLNIPQTPKPKKYTSKLVAVGISLVLSAVLVAAIAFFLCIRMRRRRGLNDDKACESESSSRWFHSGAGNGAHEHGRSPPPSSEFLYLGTLVNSRGGGVEDHAAPNRGGGGGNGHARKMDSPELHPLPPLTRRQNYGNAEMGYGGDEEDEEFYSPRGSSGGGRESSIATRSASRRAFVGVVAECESSSSYSSSSSDSPTRSMSVSISISPPVSLSPISSRHKSPELVALQVAPPPSSPPPIMTQFGNRRNLSSLSPSSSPDRPLLKSQDSSNVSEEDSDFPVRMGGATKQRLAVFVPPPPPPPPPPLPPPRTWVSPVSTPIRAPVLKPPVLIKPSRPVVFQSPKSISPMELPPQSRTLEKNEDIPKPKLKPLHWDKVRASSGREMVWDQLKSSSFKLNEEMIETLFLVNTPNTNMNEPTTRRSFIPSPNEENRVLDPKKSQNIAISLRALNVTIDEVCEALVEGNADSLGPELLECLLKMAPTKEEERKLREYNDDSPFKLGPAERFLKAVLDIPFAFKRVDAMLYIANFDSEVEYLKRSFGTLEAACEELKNSRMFLKLLEAVLKTGNRMNVGTNRGDAQAFKLDTLLKLVDIKAADGKTNLLHFVVQEIIKSEGTRLSGAAQNPKSPLNDDSKCRKLGLQVVSGLSSELTNVKKAAAMDSDVLSGDVLKLSKGIVNIREVIRLSKAMGSEESSWKFSESMNKFMKMAEEGIVKVQAQESLALSLVKEITEYFHGNSAKEEAHPFRIFMVVRDFLTVLDRVCKEVGMINEQTNINSTHKFQVPMNPTLPQAFIGFPGRPICNSSDDESSYS